MQTHIVKDEVANHTNGADMGSAEYDKTARIAEDIAAILRG